MQINSLVILGPTATGKTQLSLKLSQYFDSEIINCDTSIFYKYLSIASEFQTQSHPKYTIMMEHQKLR